jgi:uncharacterized protein (DUF2237 family)
MYLKNNQLLLICLLLIFLLCFFCNDNYEYLSSTDNNSLNINGESLEKCSTNPDKITGWFRDGYCRTDDNDTGTHTVCAKMTDEFLNYTRDRGNDLTTSTENFSGLVKDDYWCLCALRWKEAFDDNIAPPVKINSTHSKSLEYIEYSDLINNSI